MTSASLRASERGAKPIGFIMLRDNERTEYEALTDSQKGYFLHWIRSNQGCVGDYWRTAMRKARGQR